MKMKNLYKVLFATLMIGLLVITGCNGFFDPPGKPAAKGEGTLLVTVNGAEGRTILPASSLKYVLQLYTVDGEGTETPFGAERILTGATGIGLSAGSYKVEVKGYEGEVLVAQKSAAATVAAETVVNVNIVLEPVATGDGTFSWDLSGLDPDATDDDVAIEIYDTEDDTVDLLADDGEGNAIEVGLTGTFVLPDGVYSVKFTLGAVVWYEILYIYPNMISAYDAAAELEASAKAPVKQVYTAPASGAFFFYLDLNNWETQTPASAGINDHVPAGELAAGSLKVTFTENNQRVNIKLTAEQIDALYKSKGPVLVTLNASATDADGTTASETQFRYHLGNALSGSNWNATNACNNNNAAKISDLIANGNATAGDDTSVPIGQMPFGGNKSLVTLGYFILQSRAAVTTIVTITSIKIEFPIVEVPLFVDLSAAIDSNDEFLAGTSEGSLNTTKPTGDFGTTTADALTAIFAENNQRLIIPLSAPQVTLLKDAKTVWITVWGSSTDESQFRYHLADRSLGGGWGGTAAAGSYTLFSQLASVNGVTTTLNVDVPENCKEFILQQRAAGTPTVTISKIRIDYENNPPPACNCDDEDCSDDPFMVGCTGVCSCPKPGTLQNNNNLGDTFPGLAAAGGPKINLLTDGGLFIYDRPNNYSAVDLAITSLNLEAAKYYRITATGKAIASAAAAQIVLGERPYSGLESKALTEFGTAGEVVTFTITTTQTGAVLTTRTYADNDEGPVPDTYNNRPRIRVMEGDGSAAGSNPNFVIDSIELIEVTNTTGDTTTGTALISFNLD